MAQGNCPGWDFTASSLLHLPPYALHNFYNSSELVRLTALQTTQAHVCKLYAHIWKQMMILISGFFFPLWLTAPMPHRFLNTQGWSIKALKLSHTWRFDFGRNLKLVKIWCCFFSAEPSAIKISHSVYSVVDEPVLFLFSTEILSSTALLHKSAIVSHYFPIYSIFISAKENFWRNRLIYF